MGTSAVREVVKLMLKCSKIRETSKTLRGLQALALIEKRGKRKVQEKKYKKESGKITGEKSSLSLNVLFVKFLMEHQGY